MQFDAERFWTNAMRRIFWLPSRMGVLGVNASQQQYDPLDRARMEGDCLYVRDGENKWIVFRSVASKQGVLFCAGDPPVIITELVTSLICLLVALFHNATSVTVGFELPN